MMKVVDILEKSLRDEFFLNARDVDLGDQQRTTLMAGTNWNWKFLKSALAKAFFSSLRQNIDGKFEQINSKKLRTLTIENQSGIKIWSTLS